MSWKQFRQDLKSEMTSELCADVRRLRCDEHNTWRGVASNIFEQPSSSAIVNHQDMAGNQALGMYLCELCAEQFGENPNEEPWN